jgi:hypothetical protein
MCHNIYRQAQAHAKHACDNWHAFKARMHMTIATQNMPMHHPHPEKVAATFKMALAPRFKMSVDTQNHWQAHELSPQHHIVNWHAM